MQNVKLTVAYDGTNYHGWQRQPKGATVQEELEKALSKVLNVDIKVVGASRTDAGVHAHGQVASFTATQDISCEKLKRSVNSLLPGDVVVKDLALASEDFHARHSAKGKCYCYLIIKERSPFLNRFAYSFTAKLDVARMREAAKGMLGRHDFSSFRASERGKARRSIDPVCNLEEISILPHRVLKFPATELSLKVPHLAILLKGDRFLYNMVRIMTGTLLEVGRGKVAPADVVKILDGRDRKLAGPTLPAMGLHLIEVRY